MTCSIGECDRLVKSRGWCSVHYGRWRRWGDPLISGSDGYQHRLSDVDVEARTATCAACGSVPIRRKAQGWRCARVGAYRPSGGRDVRSQHSGLRRSERRANWEAQDRRCAICGEEIAFEKAHQDHDHETGQCRGILCAGCNIGLGRFGDDPERLRLAAAYLDRFA